MMKYEKLRTLRRLIPTIALLLVQPPATFGAADSIEPSEKQKCEDPFFFREAVERFTCETELSLDACSFLSIARPLGGAVAGAVVANTIDQKLAEPRARRVFDEYIRLKNEANAAWEEKIRGWQNRFRISQRWSPSQLGRVGPFDWIEKRSLLSMGQWSESIKKYDDLKIKHPEVVNEYNKFEQLEKTQEKKWTDLHKRIEDYEKRWNLGSNNPKVEPTLRDQFNKLRELESKRTKPNYEKLNMEAFRDHFPEHKDYAQEGVDKQKAQLADLEKPISEARAAARARYVKLNTIRSAGARISSGAIGAVAGVAISELPEIINFVNSKMCKNLEGQEEAREFLKISPGRNQCQVSIQDRKEIELYLKSDKERYELFQKIPLLCQAWIKKVEARKSRMAEAQARPTLTSCSRDKVEATIEIRGRNYQYSIVQQNGRLELRSPFGTKMNNNPKDPVEIVWNYNPSTKSISSAQTNPNQLWVQIPSDQRDLNKLNNFYNFYGNTAKPMPQIEKAEVLGHSGTLPKDIMLTVAEQTAALKQAIPEILGACSFIAERTGTTSGRETSTKDAVR